MASTVRKEEDADKMTFFPLRHGSGLPLPVLFQLPFTQSKSACWTIVEWEGNPLSWLTYNSLRTYGESLLKVMEAWKANFSSWVGDNPCSGWERVTCDSLGRVIELNLSNAGIVGPVPANLVDLKYLTLLDLSNPRYNPGPLWNAVSGDLAGLEGLTNLQYLDVSFNNITLDSFPSAVFKLTNLVTMRIDNLRIGGPLPKELLNLTKLEKMYLANNSLEGPIPPEYGNMKALKEISLWNNNLNSKIPFEFGNLRNLTYLNLHECNLYGGLPPELGNCVEMLTISLYGNFLTGILPDTWKNMTKLNTLWLHRNSLTKYFPEWLPSLPKLYNVSLDQNLFYGSVPNFPNASLQIMSLTCNYFSGAVPTKFSNLVLNTSGNCFDPIDNSNKIRCQQRYYDCSTFFSEVPSGTCPECPNTQILEDQSTCVCTIPSASTGSGSNKSKLIGSIVGVGVFLLVVAVLFWFLYKYRREQKRRCKGLSELWDGPEGIIRYHIEDIVAATDNFDKKHQIGVGGFGSVYLAVLDGREVAIKVANSSSIQSTMGFRNEVLLLSRLHHVNLVHLLGFCEAEGIQILGYEYMSNGNLHTMLFGNTSVLDWLTRLDIALGVAHGLEYLHSFADPPVIHRDVKLSNVLLDYNMVAKLSDFGISKVAPELDSEMATRPCGTAGYIDPQYVLTEQLTTASDVYSFGVVLLELFTGQKCINKSRKEGENLVEWVSIKLEDEGLESVVDPRLGDNYPKQMFYDMIRLGLDCAAFKSSARPSMKAVVTILDQCRWSVAPELPVLNSIGSQKAGQQDDSYSHDYVQDADKSSEVYIQLVNESTIEPPLDPR